MDPWLLILLTAYAAICLIVGLYGRRRRIGFIFSYLLALLLTPPVVLILLFLLGQRGDLVVRKR